VIADAHQKAIFFRKELKELGMNNSLSQSKLEDDTGEVF
jgi:hypothetical protein